MGTENKGFIRRDESLDNYEEPLLCPVCHEQVVPTDTDPNLELTPCEHTLFIATDDGFEYRSDEFDQLMNIVGIESDDLEIEDNIDAFTDRVPLPNAIKYAIYTPAPGFLGAYIGFKLIN